MFNQMYYTTPIELATSIITNIITNKQRVDFSKVIGSWLIYSLVLP